MNKIKNWTIDASKEKNRRKGKLCFFSLDYSQEAVRSTTNFLSMTIPFLRACPKKTKNPLTIFTIIKGEGKYVPFAESIKNSAW